MYHVAAGDSPTPHHWGQRAESSHGGATSINRTQDRKVPAGSPVKFVTSGDLPNGEEACPGTEDRPAIAGRADRLGNGGDVSRRLRQVWAVGREPRACGSRPCKHY